MRTKRTRQPPDAAVRPIASEAAGVRRWLDGHATMALLIRQAAAEEGPSPAQAVAEALSAANALAVMVVRRRWARSSRRRNVTGHPALRGAENR